MTPKAGSLAHASAHEASQVFRVQAPSRFSHSPFLPPSPFPWQHLPYPLSPLSPFFSSLSCPIPLSLPSPLSPRPPSNLLSLPCELRLGMQTTGPRSGPTATARCRAPASSAARELKSTMSVFPIRPPRPGGGFAPLKKLEHGTDMHASRAIITQVPCKHDQWESVGLLMDPARPPKKPRAGSAQLAEVSLRFSRFGWKIYHAGLFIRSALGILAPTRPEEHPFHGTQLGAVGPALPVHDLANVCGAVDPGHVLLLLPTECRRARQSLGRLSHEPGA